MIINVATTHDPGDENFKDILKVRGGRNCRPFGHKSDDFAWSRSAIAQTFPPLPLTQMQEEMDAAGQGVRVLCFPCSQFEGAGAVVGATTTAIKR